MSAFDIRVRYPLPGGLAVVERNTFKGIWLLIRRELVVERLAARVFRWLAQGLQRLAPACHASLQWSVLLVSVAIFDFSGQPFSLQWAMLVSDRCVQPITRTVKGSVTGAGLLGVQLPQIQSGLAAARPQRLAT